LQEQPHRIGQLGVLPHLLALQAAGGEKLGQANANEARNVMAVEVVVLYGVHRFVYKLHHTGTHALGDVCNHYLIPVGIERSHPDVAT